MLQVVGAFRESGNIWGIGGFGGARLTRRASLVALSLRGTPRGGEGQGFVGTCDRHAPFTPFCAAAFSRGATNLEILRS